jgi:hypothetical protein
LNKASQIRKVEASFDQLAQQVAFVMEALGKDPSKEEQILMAYISHFYEAVKEAIRKHGSVMPYYFTVADSPDFGLVVTDEVIRKAHDAGAKAIVSVEGFQSDDDISDVIYHVSLSAPCSGVLGWVLRVKHVSGGVNVVRELPYLFDSPEKVKTLGELVSEMESAPEG